MARYDDSSIYHERWTNRKLIDEARKYANLASFDSPHFDGKEVVMFKPGWANQTGSADIGDFCRERTRLYRDSYLNPLLDELERRLIKDRK